MRNLILATILLVAAVALAAGSAQEPDNMVLRVLPGPLALSASPGCFYVQPDADPDAHPGSPGPEMSQGRARGP